MPPAPGSFLPRKQIGVAMVRSTHSAMILLVALLPTALRAQRAPSPRFESVRPVRLASLPGVPAAQPRDTGAFQGNVATVVLGSGVLAVAGMVAGGGAGFLASGATSRGCGDDMCGLLAFVVGATAGEFVGAGLGGYLGGGRRGNVWLDILAATAVGAAGWVPTVKHEVGWYLIPAAQVTAVTIVDRVRANRWKRRDLPR